MTPSHPAAKLEGCDTCTCGTELKGGGGVTGTFVPELPLPPQAATTVRSATTPTPRCASMCFALRFPAQSVARRRSINGPRALCHLGGAQRFGTFLRMVNPPVNCLRQRHVKRACRWQPHAPDAPASSSGGYEDRRRVLEALLQCLDHRGGVVTIDEAMVERGREIHGEADGDG